VLFFNHHVFVLFRLPRIIDGNFARSLLEEERLDEEFCKKKMLEIKGSYLVQVRRLSLYATAAALHY
jgi:hypothetical protein